MSCHVYLLAPGNRNYLKTNKQTNKQKPLERHLPQDQVRSPSSENSICTDGKEAGQMVKGNRTDEINYHEVVKPIKMGVTANRNFCSLLLNILSLVLCSFQSRPPNPACLTW